MEMGIISLLNLNLNNGGKEGDEDKRGNLENQEWSQAKDTDIEKTTIMD